MSHILRHKLFHPSRPENKDRVREDEESDKKRTMLLTENSKAAERENTLSKIGKTEFETRSKEDKYITDKEKKEEEIKREISPFVQNKPWYAKNTDKHSHILPLTKKRALTLSDPMGKLIKKKPILNEESEPHKQKTSHSSKSIEEMRKERIEREEKEKEKSKRLFK